MEYYAAMKKGTATSHNTVVSHIMFKARQSIYTQLSTQCMFLFI